MNSAEVFDEIVRSRRAVRLYDEKDYDPDSVTRSLERAVLAPSSSNMQLWEFYRISSPELKKKVSWCCLDQNAARTAQELVVVVVRPDLWSHRAKSNLQFVLKNDEKRLNFTGLTRVKYYSRIIPFLYRNDPFGFMGAIRKLYTWYLGLSKPMYREVSVEDVRVVIHKSAALAAQTFMLSMSAEGHDTCPMEGFDSKRLKKTLQLPWRAEINMVISCGKRIPEGVYGERFRIPNEEVIKTL